MAKLQESKSAKVHPVFHVSLLAPIVKDPLPGQVIKPPPVLNTEGDNQEYEVEKIIGTHYKNGKPHYIVRWKGYGPEDE